MHNTFADLIIRDKGATPYTTFKAEIIKYLGESEKSKLNNLLHGLTLGEQKHSQLLSKFKTNAGDRLADEPLKQLWMSRLPPQVQIVLTPFENDVTLDVLAQRADNVMETMSHININSSGQNATSTNYCLNSEATNSSESKLNVKFAAMKSEIVSEISALWNKSSEYRRGTRHTSRDRASSRNRSPSNKRESDTCFYHKRFGDKAQKCITSCKYHKEFVSQHNQKN